MPDVSEVDHRMTFASLRWSGLRPPWMAGVLAFKRRMSGQMQEHFPTPDIGIVASGQKRRAGAPTYDNSSDLPP
jgi:hypothetical protein